MAYTFNGTNQSITAGDILDRNYDEPWSLAFWMKAGSQSADSKMIIGKMRNAGNYEGYLVFQRSSAGSHILRVGTQSTPSVAIYMDGTTSVNTNTWLHIVVTKSTGSTTGDFAIYVNGVAETLSLSSGANHTGSTVGTAKFGLGARDGAGQYWSGSLAEAGMWDIVLTEQQAKSLAKGMKCSRVMPQNMKFYAPLVRNQLDVKNQILTLNNGPTVANHPRIY